MRVLVGIDGSLSAKRAVELVSRINWPAGSSARIVAAVQPGDEWSTPVGGGGVPDEPELEFALLSALTEACARSESPTLRVETDLVPERPASALLDEARLFGADLIVVGHRGLGPFRSMLLGSVSAEVVSRAHCPVLVVREPSLGRLLVADDGSGCAAHAIDVISRWGIFEGQEARVVSVTHNGELAMPMRLPDGHVSEFQLEGTTRRDPAQLAEVEARAECSALRLREAGIRAIADVRVGDPAHQIVEAARHDAADLIVVGSRGHTGLARLLLGSVARNVVMQAPCSVLVVRQPAKPSLGAAIASIHDAAGPVSA